MTGLPAVSFPPSIVGTTGRPRHVARSMTGLPGVSLPLELAGVDRRHHGHGRGEGPALARPMTSCRRRSSAPRATGQGDDRFGTLARRLDARNLPPVDHRHHGHRRAAGPRAARSMTALPAVSFPASIIGTTGTAAGRPRRLPGR